FNNNSKSNPRRKTKNKPAIVARPVTGTGFRGPCNQAGPKASSAWMALARPDKAARKQRPIFYRRQPQRLDRSSARLGLTTHQPYGPYPRACLGSTQGHYRKLGTPPVRVVTSRMLEHPTYAQIGDRLNISSEGARAIVKRNRLPRSHDKNGKTVVAIDLDGLQHKPLPVRPRLPVTDVTATLKARIEQLETELTAEQH